MARPFAQGSIAYVAPTFTVDALNFLLLGETDYNAARSAAPINPAVPSPNPGPNNHIAWFNRTYTNIGKPKNIGELFDMLISKNMTEVDKFLTQADWTFTPAAFIEMFNKEITSKAAGGASFSNAPGPYAAHWNQLNIEFAANSI